MNHLLWFRRCLRSKLQMGVVLRAESGSNGWTTPPRIASESCCFITETPISAARPAFSERRQREAASLHPGQPLLGKKPVQTSPSKQTQPTKIKTSWASSSSWAISAQSLAVSLQESSHRCLCTGVTHTQRTHCTLLRRYNRVNLRQLCFET